jgi:hypothetical protein
MNVSYNKYPGYVDFIVYLIFSQSSSFTCLYIMYYYIRCSLVFTYHGTPHTLEHFSEKGKV